MNKEWYDQWLRDGEKRDNRFVELLVTCMKSDKADFGAIIRRFGQPDGLVTYSTWHDHLYFYAMKIKYDTFDMCLSIQTQGSTIIGFHVNEAPLAAVRPPVAQHATAARGPIMQQAPASAHG